MAAADETPRAYRALPKDEVRRRRIAVVGGGLTGTATAYAAARLGGADVAIDLYEATQIGHEGGASIDSVRLFRHAYGDLSHYTRWAAETFRSGVSWSGKARRRSTSRTGASGRCTPRTTWPSRPRWGTCSRGRSRAERRPLRRPLQRRHEHRSRCGGAGDQRLDDGRPAHHLASRDRAADALPGARSGSGR